MEQMYSLPSRAQQTQRYDSSKSSKSDNAEKKDQSDSSNSSGGASQVAEGPVGKILSTGGLLMAILLSLLFGLAYVVRSLKNVKLKLKLMLKRDDKAEKKY